MSGVPLNLKDRKEKLEYNINHLITNKKDSNEVLKIMIQILKHSEFVFKKKL